MIGSVDEKIPACERQIPFRTASYPRNSGGLRHAFATTARCCRSGGRGLPAGRSWPFSVTGGPLVLSSNDRWCRGGCERAQSCLQVRWDLVVSRLSQLPYV